MTMWKNADFSGKGGRSLETRTVDGQLYILSPFAPENIEEKLQLSRAGIIMEIARFCAEKSGFTVDPEGLYLQDGDHNRYIVMGKDREIDRDMPVCFRLMPPEIQGKVSLPQAYEKLRKALAANPCTSYALRLIEGDQCAYVSAHSLMADRANILDDSRASLKQMIKPGYLSRLLGKKKLLSPVEEERWARFDEAVCGQLGVSVEDAKDMHAVRMRFL